MVYEHRYLISPNDMIIIQFPVKIIVKNRNVFLSKTDPPICYVLSGEGQSIVLEFLFQAIQRNGNDIFAVYNGYRKRW